MELNQKELEDLRRLLNKTVWDMGDKKWALGFIHRNMDPGAMYCMTCDSAVIAMYRRLEKWAKRNGFID
jgi:hypothetical protein